MIKQFMNQLIEQIVKIYYKSIKWVPNKNIENLITNYYDSVINEKLQDHNNYYIIEAETENTSDNQLPNDMSKLDTILQNQDSNDDEKFDKELLQTNTPIIYAFKTKYAPNAIKVGYTTQGPEQRVNQWKKFYKDAELIDYWDASELNSVQQRVYFMDFSVHDEIKLRGYKNLLDEADINSKKEADEFRRLYTEDNIQEVYISKEFFLTYNNIGDNKRLDKELLLLMVLKNKYLIIHLKENYILLINYNHQL